ncbi:hypothetical protein FA95DRAFT_1595728 [Auriscalpium vulgare]|uniref:Uncharacterized protein n=1 Tax=Auriscalpium vulgare TaxID=40419 RepID=A0ACB8RTZ3_9AGAM|nr:hypothetical protein FA95DRAFT_1595728 [Auriscalpium vulgare]
MNAFDGPAVALSKLTIASESVAHTSAGLATVPLDILLLIFRNLEVSDICSLAQCCHRLATLTSVRPVWHSALQDLIASHIPIPPCPPLEGLSAEELRHTALHAGALRRAWTSAHPTRTRVLRVLPNLTRRMRPTGLDLVLGREHRYALATYHSLDARPDDDARHLLQCVDFGVPGLRARGWEDDGDTDSTVVAWMWFSGALSFALNEARDAAALVAVTSVDSNPTTYILGLDVSSRGAGRPWASQDTVQHGFTTLRRMETLGIPLLLRGEVLVAGDLQGNLWLYNVDTGATLYELRSLREAADADTAHADIPQVVLLPDMLLAFDSATIRQYTLSATTVADADPAEYPVLHPTVIHRWRWRIDTLSVAPLSHPLSPAPNPRPPINIWVRFGSWYPWPINMMHHYSLTSASEGAAYALPPVLVLYTYSALDMFAVAHATVGPHGTALWTDTQSDAFGEGVGGSDGSGRLDGQRIVAKVLRPLPSHVQVPSDGAEDVGLEVGAVGMMREMEGAKYDRGTTTTFGLLRREQEPCVVALDEEAGRVALALKGGEMVVWEYLPMAERDERAR